VFSHVFCDRTTRSAAKIEYGGSRWQRGNKAVVPRLIVPWTNVAITVGIPIAGMALVVIDDAVGHFLHI
jgi:hypothetical protein